MAYEPKPMTFIFGRNEKKTKEKHPDITGSMIDKDGKKWKLAGWTKIKDGKIFVTGSFSEFQERQPEIKKETLDDLPF